MKKLKPGGKIFVREPILSEESISLPNLKRLFEACGIQTLSCGEVHHKLTGRMSIYSGQIKLAV